MSAEQRCKGAIVKLITIEKPNFFRFHDSALPEPAEGEVLVKVMSCGVCGTDVHIYRGNYMGAYPVIPGHEFAGVVERLGRNVEEFKLGASVAIEPNVSCDSCMNCLKNRQNFCLNWQGIGVTRPGGMAQYAVAPAKNVFDISGISFDQGAFVEPLSCVLHGIQKTQISLASRVLIIGAGPIGLLLFQAASLQGAAKVTVVEKNPHRVTFAKEMGARNVFHKLDEVEKDGFDTVIDATGAISVMQEAIKYVRPGGTILFFGVANPEDAMQVHPFELFRKEVTLVSSYTSVRNSFQAIDLLRSGKISVERLISHRLPLSEFQKAIEIIEGGREAANKIMLLPNL
jgi:D-arabinitol dehydrogenase (NADP+)